MANKQNELEIIENGLKNVENGLAKKKSESAKKSELAIKKHSFDLAKERLKEFSENDAAEIKLRHVQTDGVLFAHKVTGEEFNDRLETIQDNFIAVNETNQKVIKEFREVYNALDVLDKDYITSIVANVKAIEKTSNDVKKQQKALERHNKEIIEQQSKLDVHQAEIEKNVENISKIVDVLNSFREELKSYEHLADIDKIWNDCNAIQDKISAMSNEFGGFKKVSENIAQAENIARISRTTGNAVDSLTRKVKYACLIAGGSMGLAIIELVLILMR